MLNDKAKFDAIRDMVHSGCMDRKPIRIPKIKISDIIDPLVSYGFEGSRIGYIDFHNMKVDALGALVLGLDAEDCFPRHWSAGLMETLASRFGVAVNFLHGMESGWKGEPIFDTCPENLLDQDMKDGYEFGASAWLAYSQPTKDRL